MQIEDLLKTPIIICADDYGLDAGISMAIRDLAHKGVISATSCMVNGENWNKAAPYLAEIKDKIDIGLHLTFTELSPLAPMPDCAPDGYFPSIGTLMRRSALRQLQSSEIMAESRRQIEAFMTATGHPPSHIDGHQHVHVFPIIRDAVLQLATEYGCAVRRCTTPLASMKNGMAQASKAIAVNVMASSFNRQLTRRQLRHNTQFFGFHPFNPASDIHAQYEKWLATAQPDSMMNCHPSMGMQLEDPLAAWRQYEYGYLASPQFATLLAKHNCRIARFPPPAPTF